MKTFRTQNVLSSKKGEKKKKIEVQSSKLAPQLNSIMTVSATHKKEKYDLAGFNRVCWLYMKHRDFKNTPATFLSGTPR